MCNCNVSKIERMNPKAQFSLAVRTLANKGFSNDLIASLLKVSRYRVGAVMAWHKHRNSWG